MGKYTFECDCRPGDVVYTLEPQYKENDIDIKVVPQKVDAIMSICFCGRDDEFYTYPAYYQEGHFEVGGTSCEGQSKRYFLTVDEAKDERLRLLSILNGTNTNILG